MTYKDKADAFRNNLDSLPQIDSMSRKELTWAIMSEGDDTRLRRIQARIQELDLMDSMMSIDFGDNCLQGEAELTKTGIEVEKE